MSWKKLLILSLLASFSVACQKTQAPEAGLAEKAASEGKEAEDKAGKAGKAWYQVKTAAVERLAGRIEDKVELANFVAKQYDFAFRLMREAGLAAGTKALTVSPYSIQSALAMPWMAAAGDTADEMASALGFDAKSPSLLNAIDQHILAQRLPGVPEQAEAFVHAKDPIELETANRLYISEQHTWRTAWLEDLAKYFGASLYLVDYQTQAEQVRQKINEDVLHLTRQKIKDLVPAPLSAQTELVLTNAIYFKAGWEHSYHKAFEKEDFTRLDGQVTSTEYFEGSHRGLYYADAQVEAALAPLRDQRFQVLFVMPKAGQWASVAGKFNGDYVQEIFSGLKQKDRLVLKAPIFTQESSINLTKLLQALSMRLAFTASADFSAMTEGPNQIAISQVLHKTFVAMDEKGLEAAAATAVVMEAMAMPLDEEVAELLLTRPFYYIVFENETRSPLFVGNYMGL